MGLLFYVLAKRVNKTNIFVGEKCVVRMCARPHGYEWFGELAKTKDGDNQEIIIAYSG